MHASGYGARDTALPQRMRQSGTACCVCVLLAFTGFFKTSEVRETGVNVLPGSCVGQQLYPACQGVADDSLPCVRVCCHVGNSPAGCGRRRRARRRTGFDAGVSWSRGRSRGINLQPAQRGKCHVESGTVPLALCYQRPYLFPRVATLRTPAVAGSPATASGSAFRLWLGRETSIASITAACHPVRRHSFKGSRKPGEQMDEKFPPSSSHDRHPGRKRRPEARRAEPDRWAAHDPDVLAQPPSVSFPSANPLLSWVPIRRYPTSVADTVMRLTDPGFGKLGKERSRLDQRKA